MVILKADFKIGCSLLIYVDKKEGHIQDQREWKKCLSKDECLFVLPPVFAGEKATGTKSTFVVLFVSAFVS